MSDSMELPTTLEAMRARDVAMWEAARLTVKSQRTAAILVDLIAELRALNQNRDGGVWADDVHDTCDRAEARLREVQG